MVQKGQQWKWDAEHLTDPTAIAKNIVPGTGRYIRDEMLGIDDFSRIGGKLKSGDFGGAAKSYATGVGELGLTAASLVAGFFSGGAGTVGIQAAKIGAKEALKAGVKAGVKAGATSGVKAGGKGAAVKAATEVTKDSARAISAAEKAMRGSTTTRASETIKKAATELNPAVRQANSATKASAEAIKAAEKAAGIKPPAGGYPSFRPGGSAPGKGGYPGGSTSGRPAGGSAPGRGGRTDYPETGGGNYGRGGSGGGTGGGRGGRGPGGNPGKVMPDGGRAPGRTTTIERDAPSSTRPDWDPLKDTKPFNPYNPSNNPKLDPWPIKTPTKPGPAPAPAPRKPSTPPVKVPTKTPKTTSPWAPKSAAPDAIKPPTKIMTETSPTPATQLQAATGTSNALKLGRAAAFGVGTGVALKTFMPSGGATKPEKDSWVPSAIV